VHAGIYYGDQTSVCCLTVIDADVDKVGDQIAWLTEILRRVTVHKIEQLPAPLRKHYSWVIPCFVARKHNIFSPKLASC